MNCPTAASAQAASWLAIVSRFLAYWGQHFWRRQRWFPSSSSSNASSASPIAVANALAEAEIASEIYSTAGDYDLLVKFSRRQRHRQIGHFVNEKVQVIPGIQDTHTIITFKAFGIGLIQRPRLPAVDFADAAPPPRGPQGCAPSCPRHQYLLAGEGLHQAGAPPRWACRTPMLPYGRGPDGAADLQQGSGRARRHSRLPPICQADQGRRLQCPAPPQTMCRARARQYGGHQRRQTAWAHLVMKRAGRDGRSKRRATPE